MSEFRARRPDATEHAPYYSRYIDLVPEGDVLATLGDQVETTVAALRDLSVERADFAYAPAKWTVRQVLGHLIDSERGVELYESEDIVRYLEENYGEDAEESD